MNNSSDDTSLISDTLTREYLRERQDNLEASKVFYFDHLMPHIQPIIENTEEHKLLRQSIRNRGIDCLVSLMGMSPETTVHTTAILRPSKLLIAHSKDARDAAEPAIEYLVRKKLIKFMDIVFIEVDHLDPQNVYDRIDGALETTTNLIFDITGGTKVMSAAAGALAWERNIDLCYLNGNWDPRSGSAGLRQATKIHVIQNPSKYKGIRQRREGLNSYLRGNFVAAKEAFQSSQKLIDSDTFDDFAINLCETYSAVSDFDMDRVRTSLDALEKTIQKASVRKYHEPHFDMTNHIEGLRRFANKDQTIVAAVLIELAKLYASRKRYDFSGLLWYRAMEALVRLGVRSLAPKFDFDNPDWQQIDSDLALLKLSLEHASVNEPEFKYADWRASSDNLELIRIAFELTSHFGNTNIPNNKIGLADGFQLMCILDLNMASRFLSERPIKPANIPTLQVAKTALGHLIGLGKLRNQSYLAHGTNKLGAKDCARIQSGTEKLARAVMGEALDEFNSECQRIRPLNIEPIVRSM